MYKHILIPTDGSLLASKAAQAAVKLAAQLGARVTGFYAAPPATPVEFKGLFPVGYDEPVDRARAIEKAAAQYLGAIDKAAQAAGVRCKLKRVTDDYPAEAIVRAAKRHKCDLVFMASHGRGGFKRSLLGSQTQKVLSQSTIPVLVHRPRA